MTLQVKICGLRSREAVGEAVRAGAAFAGFVFFPRSPRAVTEESAAELIRMLPPSVTSVALLVDPDDRALERALAVRPGMLQLHGAESPARVAQIRARAGLPVMKAVGIARREDLEDARKYEGVADRLLFDAKAPRTAGSLPGGNGVPFDWRLLGRTRWRVPWMLSGGLTPDNVGRAVSLSGARAVDVSSGVETSPGVKDPARIRAFMEAAKREERSEV
ncbi:MAG: phosphoribosylanthranilate isomerase [Alphaproteobacteria bacterium]